MNFDILRQRILEKAIQGKLVPQLESEPEVNQVGEPPENVSFSIPEKWKWIHFSEAIETVSTKLFQIKSKEVLDKGLYPVVSQSKEILDGYSDNKNKLIPESKLPIILFGDHTRVLKYIDYRFIVGADGTKLLRVKNPALYPKYVYMALKWLINLTRERGYSRHFQFIKCVYLPCPPLEEQQRIIEKTKQLFDQINQAEKAYNELSGPLSERFRQLCLEKAIQGKLVPQLESEPETDRTISSVKEAPFKIPEKWQWCKLSDALEIQNGDRGKNYPSKSKLTDNNTGLPFVSALNLESFKISHKNLLYLYPEQYEKLRSGHIKINDCLLCIRGSLGKFGFATQSGGAIASSLVILRSKDDSFISPKYLKIFLQSLFFKEQINLRQNGTAQPNLSAKDLSNFLIPIPPVAEQRRIASKFEEICKIMKII